MCSSKHRSSHPLGRVAEALGNAFQEMYDGTRVVLDKIGSLGMGCFEKGLVVISDAIFGHFGLLIRYLNLVRIHRHRPSEFMRSQKLIEYEQKIFRCLQFAQGLLADVAIKLEQCRACRTRDGSVDENDGGETCSL